jgi:hypothetical protein
MRNQMMGGSVRIDMGKHRWATLALGIALVLSGITACATPTGDGQDDSAVMPGATTGASATPGPGDPAPTGSGTKTGDPGDMLDPDPPGTPKTLRGTPAEGVEAGCVVMTADDGKVYLLLGGDPSVIRSGSRIEVEALIQPDLMTTCQQGIPAVVTSARKI